MCIHHAKGLPEQRPAVEFLREWRQKYLDLEWVLNRGDHVVVHPDDDDEDWFMVGSAFLCRSMLCQVLADFCPHPR